VNQLKSVTVPDTYNNKKLDRFLKETFKNLPLNAIYKALRTKDIRVNGVKASQNVVLQAGDQLDIYIKDEVLYGTFNAYEPIGSALEIVFEDHNLLLVNKQPSIPVHTDIDPNETTLLDMAVKYLEEKREYISGSPNSFAPALCHRLDRNTGGIIIIAKTPEALAIMLDKIKKREVKKYYQCLVIGCPNPMQAELKSYLFKDSSKSLVHIYNERKPGAVEIITRYKVLEAGEEISRLEVELVTGKTHQIRAHLAHIGHPIVGDGKYGINKFNRKVGAKHQALWAYKVKFDFKEGGILSYLKGKTFETKVDFVISPKTSWE
jgi:23S rRNA pseudouridine955/2504/2580 synthase